MSMASDLVVIDASGLNELFRQLTGPELLRRMNIAMLKWVAKIASTAAEDAPKDTGQLAASLAYDVWVEAADIWGVVYTPLMYGAVMEFGREPGGMYPPKGALLAWMGRHGWSEEEEDTLRYTISVKGIVPQPFLRPAAWANEEFGRQALLDALTSEE